MNIYEIKDKVFEIETRLDDAISDLVPFEKALEPLFKNIMLNLRECRTELMETRTDE